MTINVPSAEQVRAALAPLNLKQLGLLEELSGVPATTIYKIKRGETPNPGIETVHRFMPFISQVLAMDAGLSGPAPRQAQTAG